MSGKLLCLANELEESLIQYEKAPDDISSRLDRLLNKQDNVSRKLDELFAALDEIEKADADAIVSKAKEARNKIYPVAHAFGEDPGLQGKNIYLTPLLICIDGINRIHRIMNISDEGVIGICHKIAVEMKAAVWRLKTEIRDVNKPALASRLGKLFKKAAEHYVIWYIKNPKTTYAEAIMIGDEKGMFREIPDDAGIQIAQGQYDEMIKDQSEHIRAGMEIYRERPGVCGFCGGPTPCLKDD